MPHNPIFPPSPILAGDEEHMADEKARRQVNYYVDPENDTDIRREVFERKTADLSFSASKLTNEALKIYFMVRRFQREYKNSVPTYDLVREATVAHLTGGIKKPK
jgi:hypothetical protein